MLKSRKCTSCGLIEIKRENKRLRGLLRKLGSEKFVSDGKINNFRKMFNLKDTDKVVKLDLDKNHELYTNNDMVTIDNMTIEKYKAINKLIKEYDYIIFNLGKRKFMLRTSNISELMFICDDMYIVLREEAA